MQIIRVLGAPKTCLHLHFNDEDVRHYFSPHSNGPNVTIQVLNGRKWIRQNNAKTTTDGRVERGSRNWVRLVFPICSATFFFFSLATLVKARVAHRSIAPQAVFYCRCGARETNGTGREKGRIRHKKPPRSRRTTWRLWRHHGRLMEKLAFSFSPRLILARSMLLLSVQAIHNF